MSTDEVRICPSCHGAGVFDDGDCELGIWETCQECNGYGVIYDDL